MRLVRQLINVCKEAFKSLWRNKTMAFTSTISIAAMLTLLGVVLLLVLNLNAMVYQTGEKLPASITVEMKELSQGLDVKNKYKDLPIVEDVEYQYDFISKMMRFENGLKYVGIAIVAILFLVSVLIMHNTIKIAIANRENEISIMRYIGATNSYIRGPFLIEGILFGVFGALIATFLTVNFYSYLFERINMELFKITNIDLVGVELVKNDLFIVYLCIGIGIGYLGSLFSTKRFLNV